MRAILINPIDHTVKETDIIPSVSAMQEAVGGGYFELATTFANGDDLFVNEEGLALFSDYFDIGAHQPFAGPGLILSHSEASGASRPAVSSVKDIEDQIVWLKFIRRI
jgi:hypothetical protein